MVPGSELAADVLDVVATEARPKAVMHMVAAHDVMVALQAADVARGGCWRFTPTVWQRFDRPWAGTRSPAGARLLGSMYVRHGAPTAYDVVIEAVTVTPAGKHTGWSPESICDEALGFAGLSLADCGRLAPSATPNQALPTS